MADPHAKPSKPPAPKDTMVLDFVVVAIVAFIVFVGTKITVINFDTIVSGEASRALFTHITSFIDVATIQNFILSMRDPMGVIALLFLGGIFWTTIKANEIHHHEHEKYKAIPVEEEEAEGRMVQWKVVLEHVISENPAEWKLAILEADNMLDEILEEQGYLGDTLADKLKAMSSTRLASYNEVWEAHKLRNQIAHGGAMEMDLTKKMARDAVAQFGNAFKELGVL